MLTRSIRLIIIHIKEYIIRPPLWKRSIAPLKIDSEQNTFFAWGVALNLGRKERKRSWFASIEFRELVLIYLKKGCADKLYIRASCGCGWRFWISRKSNSRYDDQKSYKFQNQFNATPLHLWRLCWNMFLHQGIISFQTQIPFSFAKPKRRTIILFKSNFSSRVNMLCQKNKERWAAYLVLFVIMHDVGILRTMWF